MNPWRVGGVAVLHVLLEGEGLAGEDHKRLFGGVEADVPAARWGKAGGHVLGKAFGVGFRGGEVQEGPLSWLVSGRSGHFDPRDLGDLKRDPASTGGVRLCLFERITAEADLGAALGRQVLYARRSASDRGRASHSHVSSLLLEARIDGDHDMLAHALLAFTS
ncbi:hypothetical protein ACH40E_21305 [Streptomyces acidicola]|uniref:hypothetical protein n=1 Tax=Streptomyces acidicola TaxID=2596892 RepID=UPI00378C6FD4